jgi:hypothetical protein
MADLDTSKGWCCNGKTWTEHAHESDDGDCCQPEGTQISDLSGEAREKAEERLSQSS